MKFINISSILKRLILIVSSAIVIGIIVVIITSEYIQFKADLKQQQKLLEHEKKMFLKIACKNVISYLTFVNSTSEREMKNKLTNAVNNAIIQATSIYNQNKSTKSEEQIKRLIKTTLKNTRYFKGRGYIYIIESSGELSMYPYDSNVLKAKMTNNPEWKGKNILAEQLEAISEKSEIFYTYHWPKTWTNDTTLYEKTAFLKRFEPFDWIIACGEYSDEQLRETKEKALHYLRNSYSKEDWNLFINDFDGTAMIINSEKYAAGVNIKNISDENGIKIFEEELRIAKTDTSDYLYYQWPSKANEFVPKLAYITSFKDWNWIVGASTNLNIQNQLKQQRVKTFYQFSWMHLTLILLAIVPFAFIILLQIQKTGSKIKLEFSHFFNQLELALTDKKSMSESKFQINEFQNLTLKVNQLLYSHIENSKALKESEEKFRILVEYAPLTIIGIDNQGTVKIWNKQCEKFFNRSKKDILNKYIPITHIFEENHVEFVKEKLFTADSNFQMIPIRLKNENIGYQYWASFQVSENLIIWIGNDVTNLKKTEEQLIINRNFLNSLIEGIPSPVFYKDIKGNYLGANKAFYKLVNKNPEDLIGKGVYDLWSENLAKKYYEMDLEVFNGKEQQYDYIYGENENIRNFTYYKAPLYNLKGGVIGLVGVMLDITDRIKIENELIENEKKLKASNETKDMFFSIIAHDLINPFNVMINSSEILAECLNEQDLESANEMLKLLNPAIKNGYGLLTNLLDWAQSQSGTIKFSPKSTEINSEIKSVVESMTEMANLKNIKLLFEASTTVIINVDRNMIHTIIRNLISNAIKFTKEGGNITIKTSNLYDYLMISVIDNGMGMTEETVSNIFNNEHVITRKGTDGEKGTGLGLLLVNDFVKFHNGKISIESDMGKGTSFNIWLPII